MISNKQLHILAFPYTDYDGIICDGAVRSGKTSIMMWAFINWAMENFEFEKFGICGKSVGSVIQNVISPFMNMSLAKETFQIKFKRSENMLVISKGESTNWFELFGGRDERSQDLIQGRTLAGVLLDEVALMPKSFVNQAVARCSVDGSKLWFSCNPSNPQHWFKQEWIDKTEEKNILYLHFTMNDNPSLTEKILKRYESMYDGVFYDRYILGKWVSAEGLIYDMFSKDRHVIDDYKVDIHKPYYISSDYGIQNATVFEFWQQNEDKWINFNEYYYSGRENRKQKTVSELVDDLDTMLPVFVDDMGIEQKVFPEFVVVDPSATALIAELKKRGYRVKKAKNDVLEGIQDVSTLLRLEKLLFCKRCENAIREFCTYAWDSKATQRGEDMPLKTDDHCQDAIRYFVKTMKLVKKMDKEEDTLPIMMYM